MPEVGLSRYWDSGDGPAPEVISDERDERGRTHYDRVREYYRTQKVTDYDLAQYYDRERDQLTPLFYRGDRSMRESGFDPSNRFGPFSVDIIHYVPVCLNSLLYQMELDTAEIVTLLGDQSRGRHMARPRGQPQGAGQRADVGRGCGAVLRLQLPDEAPPGLRVRDDVLPALGGYCRERRRRRACARTSRNSKRQAEF